jgi:hypothetical protein
MDIYLSEQAIRKLIRQELTEVLQEEGIETKQNEEQKIKKTNNTIGIIKKLIASGLATAGITTAIEINDQIAKAQAIKLQQSKDQEMMQLSDKVDETISNLIQIGVKEDAAQKIVIGVVVGVEKQEKDDSNLFTKKMEALEEIDNLDTIKLVLSDKFLTDMRNEGNQVMTTIATQEGAFGVLSTKLDQSVAGMAVEVQKNLESLDVKTGIVKLEVGDNKEQKLRTITFDPLDLSYWDDKIEQGSKIEQSLHTLYGELTIPAFMYETVAPTVATQQIASELKENKKTRGNNV